MIEAATRSVPQIAQMENISDTALWVAHWRALESERPDAHLHDPFARRLAGTRGEQVAAQMGGPEAGGWPVVARTHVIDQIILEEIERNHVDTVLNLAAGLDARPFRLDMPAGLRWIDADLPAVMAYKAEQLAEARPKCAYESMAIDLRDREARKDLFRKVGSGSQHTLVITEGLVLYLTETQVGDLAKDLHEAGGAAMRTWLVDLVSPMVLKRLQKHWNATLSRAAAPMQFGPKQGADFFRPYGWVPAEFRSLMPVAVAWGRAPLDVRFWATISRPIPAARQRFERTLGVARLRRA